MTMSGGNGILAAVPGVVVQSAAVAELLEQTVRAIHAASFAHGLNPAQWNALRYLKRANPSARTSSAFAQNHLTSKGTASQTIAALIKKGLVTKTQDLDDMRTYRLDLTAAGRTRLADDPMLPIVHELRNLAPQNLLQFAETIELITRAAFARNPRLSAEHNHAE